MKLTTFTMLALAFAVSCLASPVISPVSVENDRKCDEILRTIASRDSSDRPSREELRKYIHHSYVLWCDAHAVTLDDV